MSKPATEFYRDKRTHTGLTYACRVCSNRRVKAYRATPEGRAKEKARKKTPGRRKRAGKRGVRRRRAKRDALVALMGGYCRICLTPGPPAIFDFHHREPSEKGFGMEQVAFSKPWPALLAEAEKCVLLCATCHRVLHLLVSH